MPFFTTQGGKIRRWVKASVILGVAGTGVYWNDRINHAGVIARTLSTMYNGIIIINN